MRMPVVGDTVDTSGGGQGAGGDAMTKIGQVRLSTGLGLELAERGSGRPVVFLHGYTDSWYSHNGVLEALPADVHAIVPSQRGHGGSDKPVSGYAISDFAHDVAALMNSLGVDRAPVVGHSMGSLIAQELALRFPERVSALVLNGSATTGDNEMLRGFLAETRRLADPIDRGFVAAFQSGTCAQPLGTAMSLERAIDESMKMPAHAWVAALEGILAYRPSRPLEEIACPTLIVWGDKDEIFLRPEQEMLLARIPGAQIDVYQGAGHAPHWEEPERFTRDVMAFLNGKL
jgi:pimeloyl-ACP methyl ester carboxylesterase